MYQDYIEVSKRFHDSKKERSIDEQLLGDFSQKFLFYSNGLGIFYEGFSFSIKDGLQRDGFYKEYENWLEIRGNNPLDFELGIHSTLSDRLSRIPVFVIPTETINPFDEEKYRIQFRVNASTGSRYFQLEQGLKMLMKVYDFLPIVESRRIHMFNDSSPCIPLSGIHLSKEEKYSQTYKNVVEKIVNKTFPAPMFKY